MWSFLLCLRLCNSKVDSSRLCYQFSSGRKTFSSSEIEVHHWQKEWSQVHLLFLQREADHRIHDSKKSLLFLTKKKQKGFLLDPGVSMIPCTVYWNGTNWLERQERHFLLTSLCLFSWKLSYPTPVMHRHTILPPPSTLWLHFTSIPSPVFSCISQVLQSKS